MSNNTITGGKHVQTRFEKLLMFFDVKFLVRFAVYECRHVVGLLGSEAARISLRHIVLHESRHFSDIVHPGPIVIRIWPPHGGYRVGFACAVGAVA